MPFRKRKTIPLVSRHDAAVTSDGLQRDKFIRDEYDDCRADTGDACAPWRHRPRWHLRHIESRAPCGKWTRDTGGTAHALIRPDLGDVAIRLANAKGQAHLHGAFL